MSDPKDSQSSNNNDNPMQHPIPIPNTNPNREQDQEQEVNPSMTSLSSFPPKEGDEDSADSSPSSPSEDDNLSSNASTPIIEKLPLPPNKNSTSISPSFNKDLLSTSPSRPRYIRGADTSPAASFARIPGTHPSDPPAPMSLWNHPSGSGRSKRAPTFFIGADIERWQNHDRDNMGLSNKLAWNKGTSSAVYPMVRSEGDLYHWEYDSGSASGSGSDSAEEISDEEFDDNDQAIDSDDASEDESPMRRFKSASTTSSKELFGSIGDKEKARDRLPSLGLSDLEVTDSPPSTTSNSKNTSRRSSKGAHHHDHHHHHRQGSNRSRRQSHASNTSKGSSRRERRFSTNGPEAAVHRHETVIGLHTPRRDSTSSAGSGRIAPLSGMGITPLSQIPPFKSPSKLSSQPPSGNASTVAVPSQQTEVATASPSKFIQETNQDQAVEIDFEDEDGEEPGRVIRSQKSSKEKSLEASSGKVRSGKNILQQQPVSSSKSSRSSSPGSSSSSHRRIGRKRSSIVLAEAAAAAAKAAAAGETPVQASPQDKASIGVDPNGDALSKAIDQGNLTSIKNAASSAGLKRSASPSAITSSGTRIETPALKLARRRKPIKVEGTLYDRSGPFKEGAVTDGLSVRLFSTQVAPNGSSSKNGTLTQSRRPHQPESSSNQPTTYLITTPDNRVASAAKLRRWAMDSSGKFYAAMEIKSIEAKLKNADPNVALGANLPGGAKELMKELKSTYLEDILDEVQKAETLNPSRKGTVAHVLKTEDGKFIRLEEDYPEEAFFVVAGCEEEELAPVVKLIFTMAIRALHKFHRSNWCHGDIKLENLMFDQFGELVVIDYENANPFCNPNNHRNGAAGSNNYQDSQTLSEPNQDPDGYVQLVSYDWTPPEAAIGPFGRRMGPSGDLFALGCNLVRAFALRDGIEDTMIRESLLGSGQEAFFAFRDSLIKTPRSGFPKAEDVDLKLILGLEEHQQNGNGHLSDFRKAAEENGNMIGLSGNGFSNGHHQDNTPTEDYFKTLDSTDSKTPSASTLSNSFSSQYTPPSSSSVSSSSSNPGLPSPSRILQRFATQAPRLLQYVLARCITQRVVERSLSSGAELEGLKLADQMETDERKELEIGRLAVEKAIDLSGSSWVRPKLNEARASLGLE